MLKQSLIGKLKRNFILIEYAFVDKGIRVVATTPPKEGQGPSIIGRKIIAIGKDVNPDEYIVGDDVILTNTAEFDAIAIFPDDNIYDRRKVAEKAAKDMKINDKKAFEEYLVLAYMIIPESAIACTFTKETPIDLEGYANTKTIILNVN
jgi:hypothetical protein